MDPYRDVVDAYREFAREATDSPTFVAWARSVADDPEVVEWIRSLPGIKQQPNLVFAAARWHGVAAPGPYDALRAALLEDDGTIRSTVLGRATQTNEVGRLATLLPALCRAAGQADAPVALLEVGASAGLCLYPERWAYEWTLADDGDRTVRLAPPEAAGTLTCRVSGPAPTPRELPRITWRGGIDLNPLDVTDADQMAWLEQLVWPEQDERRERLRRAVQVARADPPRIRQGNLLDGLPGLVEEASGHGTVVVVNSVVIAYLSPEDRRRYDQLVRGLVADGACHWISNEAPGVLPSVTAQDVRLPEDPLPFVLGLDGQMVARTHGHGRALHWTA